LPEIGIERERCAGEFSQLCLRFEAVAESNRIARNRPLDAGAVAQTHRPHMVVALDRQGNNALQDQQSRSLEAGPIGETAAERERAGEEVAPGGELRAEGSRIRNDGDIAAELAVLQGRKAEERRTAEERDPPANETALILEDRLGAAQREDARQGPARQRHHAIARPRGEKKRVVGNARRPFTASEIEDALMRRPGQRLRTVVDAAPEASEEGVETAVLPRLRAHQWRHVEAEARGRRAVALPADLPALVDQNRPQPRLGEHRCGPNAGGPAADNDDPRHGRSSLGGSDVQTAIAGAASVVHARTRRPVPIQTQQS
jgi:hypothetical protein